HRFGPLQMTRLLCVDFGLCPRNASILSDPCHKYCPASSILPRLWSGPIACQKRAGNRWINHGAVACHPQPGGGAVSGYRQGVVEILGYPALEETAIGVHAVPKARAPCSAATLPHGRNAEFF